MKKIFLIIAIPLFFSCSRDYRISELKLYSGIRDVTKISNDKFAFLTNLKEYNGLIAIGYINGQGELLKVQTINKDSSVDVNGDFIHLLHSGTLLNVFYEKRYKKFTIESFDSLGLVNELNVSGRSNCYGAVFQLDESKQSVYIKSEYRYNDGKHQDYKFNYIELDSDMRIKKKMVVNLGSYYPMGITAIGSNIFYYIDDRKLFLYSGETKNISPIYKFPGDIMDVKRVGDNLYVLLEDFLYIVNSSGEVTREFKLHDKESAYSALSIVETDKKGILVQFESGKDNLFRSFSVNGSQTGEFKVKRGDLMGDCYYIYRGVSNLLIYSTASDLYLKSL